MRAAISGEVTGDCTAVERVELQATARLFGNIRAPRIVIAEGAYLLELLAGPPAAGDAPVADALH